jgi:hypothetical protein
MSLFWTKPFCKDRHHRNLCKMCMRLKRTAQPMEILRATLEEACLNKGRIFSADVHPILWFEERFCRPLKKCSFEVNYVPTLSRVEIGQFFTRCSLAKNIFRTCANILALVIILLFLIWQLAWPILPTGLC